ncbi:hypothetical protein ABKN59_010887 [Abortiporus biennis]
MHAYLLLVPLRHLTSTCAKTGDNLEVDMSDEQIAPGLANVSQPEKTDSDSPGDAWRIFHKCLSQQDEDLVRGWRDEIDGLLIFSVSLALFLVGLLYQLWDLNDSVAIIATIFTALTLAFIFGTSLIPGIILDCPYRSLQASLIALTLRFLAGCFVFFLMVIFMIPVILLGVAFPRFQKVIEGPIYNPFMTLLQYISFSDHPIAKTWNVTLDDWKTLDAIMDYRTSKNHPQLELGVVEKVDKIYRGDDVRLAHAMSTCIGEMNIDQATDCLVSILSYPQRGHGTFHILLPNVLSILEKLDLKDKLTTKKILRVVNRINKTFKHKFLTPDRDILIGYRCIQSRIAEHLSHDTCDIDTTPHDPPEPITDMLYTLNNTLIISWLYRPTQEMEFDLNVFKSLTHTLTKCSSAQANIPIFYTSCRQAFRLTLLPNIPKEHLHTIHQSINELLFETFQSCLEKNSLCDYDGTLFEFQLCYIPFLLGLFDDLETFIHHYPNPKFIEKTGKLVDIIIDCVSKDVPESTCSTFYENKARFINYLEEEHDVIHHSEKNLILEKGKEWKLRLKSLKLPGVEDTLVSTASAPSDDNTKSHSNPQSEKHE